MPSDTKPLNTVITRTRFLVVVADPKIGEALRRFLASEGALGTHLVQSPVLALRILQDRRTPIDCIVCAHHAGAFSGLEFLANLRAGRWGGPSLQHLKFIVMMNSADEKSTQYADYYKATGYIIGGLSKENIRASILKALDPNATAQAPPNYKVAHMRAGETDVILAPFPPSFGQLRLAQQQQAMQAVALAAEKNQVNGSVVAIYADQNGDTAYVAPAMYERFLSRITVESIEKSLNRALYVEWIDGDPTVAAETEPPTDLLDDLFGPSSRPEEEATDRRRDAVRKEKSFNRGLTDTDIRSVALAFKEMGPAEFVQKFVRHQAILLQDQTQPLIPTMREFYVSIDLLRSTFFPGVEMRGSNRNFQSLTHMLDQLMLRSLPHLPQNDRPLSLNLNVHSILTQTFENALKNARADLLTFEIPQPMIAAHPEEFRKARGLIAAYGGKVAIDQIFPDTMGALNLDEIKPDFAKLHWKGDLKKFSSTHRDFVKRTLDHGITMVMSRVDDPAAFEIAQEFGIQNFQGFLIDEMAEANKS